jgi:farnesyl-diphosphate farnesyltransferase
VTESLSRPSAEATPTLQTPAPRATTSAAKADVEFCRTMLPRVSRTFALNIRLLRGSMGDSVRIGYLLCRIADTIEDAWPGERNEVEQRFFQLIAAVKGDTRMAEELAAGAASLRGRASAAHVELVARTPEVLRAFSALPVADRVDVGEAVIVMALGMRRYAGRAAERRAKAAGGAEGALLVPYLDDDAELKDYCWIVAGCVGVMLTRLFGRRVPASAADARRLELAPVVGEGLQLTNILLDWPSDIRGGRCHVPASWLAEFGLSPSHLVGGRRPEVQALAQRLEARARAALAQVPDYLATIPSRHVRYRMFCLWPALWAAGSLRHARRDPTFPWGHARPRLPKAELWGLAVAALARGHSASGVAGLFHGAGVAQPGTPYHR